jgi:hypothetical protein
MGGFYMPRAPSACADADDKATIAPVVFHAVLGLYDDMPAARQRSINARILYEVGGGENLAYLCKYFGPRSEAGARVEVLFSQFFWFGQHRADILSRCRPERALEHRHEEQRY